MTDACKQVYPTKTYCFQLAYKGGTVSLEKKKNGECYSSIQTKTRKKKNWSWIVSIYSFAHSIKHGQAFAGKRGEKIKSCKHLYTLHWQVGDPDSSFSRVPAQNTPLEVQTTVLDLWKPGELWNTHTNKHKEPNKLRGTRRTIEPQTHKQELNNSHSSGEPGANYSTTPTKTRTRKEPHTA